MPNRLSMLIMTSVPGKHKRDATQIETEASECELNHLFMKDSIHCSEGNECEPLDINASSDLVISHSVIISNLPEPAMATVMAVQKTWRLPVFKVTMTLQCPIPLRVTLMTWI